MKPIGGKSRPRPHMQMENVWRGKDLSCGVSVALEALFNIVGPGHLLVPGNCPYVWVEAGMVQAWLPYQVMAAFVLYGLKLDQEQGATGARSLRSAGTRVQGQK